MKYVMRKAKYIEGTRREFHQLMKQMEIRGTVVRYRRGEWAVFSPHEDRLRHAGSLNFVIKVMRCRHPKKTINGRYLEEYEQGQVPTVHGGSYSRV